MNTDLKNFLSRYNIRILEQKAIQVPSYEDFYVTRYNSRIDYKREFSIKTENTYLIEISEKSLNDILFRESEIERLQYDKKVSEYICSQHISKNAREQKLREKYPSVKEAYDHYQTMLALVQSDKSE